MKLTLDRDDLIPTSKEKSCSHVQFEDLTEDAKAAVIVVGKGTFQEYDRNNYNVVYPPQSTASTNGHMRCVIRSKQ